MKKISSKILFSVVLVGLFLVASYSLAKQETSSDDDFSKSFNSFKEENDLLKKARLEFEGNRESLAEKRYLESGKKLLEKALDVMEKRAKQIENKFDDSKAGSYGFVNLNTLREKINLAKTNEEIKQLALDIQIQRQNENIRIRRIVLASYLNQFELSIIKPAELRAEKIKEKINYIKSQGKETLELDNYLSLATSKINKSKDEIAKIKKSLETDAVFLSDLDEFQEIIDRLSGLLKDIYQIFKQIAIKGNDLFSSNLPEDNL